MMDDEVTAEMEEGDVFGNLFLNREKSMVNRIVAETDAVVFLLSVYDFYNVMANNYELAQNFIENLNQRIDQQKAVII